MARVILYIAVSLDGYIARADGSVDFLQGHRADWPGDYGYQDFISGIRAVLNEKVLPGIPAMCRKGFFLLAGQPFGPGIHVSAAHTVLTSSFQRFNSEGCMVMIL